MPNCNLIAMPFVQRAKQILISSICAAVLGAVTSSPVQAQTGSLDRAETAIKQMQNGDLKAAAVTVRQGLDGDPGALILHNVGEALLLMSGDSHGALSEWGYSLSEMPDDALARYSMGLAWLTLGEKEKSLDYLMLAQQNGDSAACLAARRYAEMMNGAEGAGSGLALPEGYAAAARGMAGMAAWKHGDQQTAYNELSAALRLLPGDPYSEPPGLVMTFEPKAPLKSGSKPLPTGNGLATPRTIKDKPRSGTVILTAGDTGGDAGYVMFKIDNGISSVANTPPFRLVWDTAQFPNGLHRIEVLVFDRQ